MVLNPSFITHRFHVPCRQSLNAQSAEFRRALPWTFILNRFAVPERTALLIAATRTGVIHLPISRPAETARACWGLIPVGVACRLRTVSSLFFTPRDEERNMRIGTMLTGLILACLVAANAPAQGSKQPPTKKPSLQERFQKMDTNGDGILTQDEFVAARSKLGDKAATVFQEMGKLGGTTTKDGAMGMTFQQFKKAHAEWKKTHPNKKQATQ
jgi:hypothetical protein